MVALTPKQVSEQPVSTRFALVCPCKAHDDKAAAAAQQRQLAIECGTAHKFQGRRYPNVIVDLMQDSGRPRWVATADLGGDQRAVSAAKLLNVAITRAQRRLYVIGDWRLIKHSDTPGIRAIAALAANTHFEVVPASDLVP